MNQHCDFTKNLYLIVSRKEWRRSVCNIGKGACSRPKGRETEARRAESRGGVLEEGASSPLAPPAKECGGAL